MATRQEKKINHWKADKANRKSKKQIKPNRKTKQIRHKNWKNQDWQDVDEWELDPFPTVERIMPLGEQRRQENRRIIQDAMLDEREDKQAAIEQNQDNLTGLVVSVSAGYCQVQLAGRQLLCSIRGALSAIDTGFTNLVAVGDRVLVSENGKTQGVVEDVFPRKSILVRPDVFNDHFKQVIVANADQLLIVASWRSPKIWFELIDRMIIAAESNNLRPIICVNKIDLAENPSDLQIDLEPYRTLGYQVLLTSAISGEGIDRLKKGLRGKMTVLAGLSGVGKSSLLNRVQPGLDIRVGELSAARNEGRHTTSQVNLMKLDGGGYIVDTPGIKEFGLNNLSRNELAEYYPEFTPFIARCRFQNCSHIQEPDCAVQEAVIDGIIPLFRYENYCKIYFDLE
ncbi:MAG: ribosome small subunit-dependent GTPase A [Anaerolineales bacterium]|nr:ribosome small subunit-dependent GTPase A [Anaerolineales bacterium]